MNRSILTSATTHSRSFLMKPDLRKLSASLLVAASLVGSCSWSAGAKREVNLTFEFQTNLLLIQADIGTTPASAAIGTTQLQTIIDEELAASRGISERDSITITLGGRITRPVRAALAPLPPGVDAIIGRDFWRDSVLVLDYRNGLVTMIQEDGIEVAGEQHRFRGVPSVPIIVDGKTMRADVDVTIPDTLLLPPWEGTTGRVERTVIIGSDIVGDIDVRHANVSRPRVGNRLLARYLLTIDYARNVVAIWPYVQ